MYKHILYATDFSKASLETEKKVANICSSFASKLSVIHVVNYNSTAWLGAGGYFVLTELNEESNDDSDKALKACEDRIPVKLANTHSVQGSPKQEIVRYAEQIGADLIVIGSHGHYQVSDILGTTATSVLNKAKCDVLVVQSGEESN
jgi:universal stress protein A